MGQLLWTKTTKLIDQNIYIPYFWSHWLVYYQRLQYFLVLFLSMVKSATLRSYVKLYEYSQTSQQWPP